MAEQNSRIVIALDLGSSELRCCAAEIGDKGVVKILGSVREQSRGFKRGVIVNLTEAVSSIKSVMHNLELSVGTAVADVHIGISGTHIGGFSSHGVTAISNREISWDDVARAIDSAKGVTTPLDRRIIHVVQQEMIIDDHDGIVNPVGLIGSRLDAIIYSFTSARFVLENVERACLMAGLSVVRVVPNHLASGCSVLTDEEKELGVMIMDMGAETTGLICYQGNSIWNADILPCGGNDLTQEIAVGLCVALNDAEKIKKAKPCDIQSHFSEGGDCAAKIERLRCIVKQEIEKLYETIQVRLDRAGFTGLARRGIVLTGGAAQTQGLAGEMSRLFKLPVRIGAPFLKDDSFNCLENAVCAGILLSSCTNDQLNILTHVDHPE